MKLTIVTTASGGGLVTIQSFNPDSVLQLVDDLRNPEPDAPDFLTFDLDDGKVTTYVARAHIVRVDLEH